MSKSKGEFLTLSLLQSKGYDPLAYRFFCLQSHYRKSLVFTYENLDNAAGAYAKLIAKIASVGDEGDYDEAGAKPYRDAFRSALENDLNTSLAVTALYDVLKSPLNGKTKRKLIDEFDAVLSLGLLAAADKVKEKDESKVDDPRRAEIEKMIAARAEAKKQKNYAEADRIRAELSAMGVTLTDTKDGTTYTIA